MMIYVNDFFKNNKEKTPLLIVVENKIDITNNNKAISRDEGLQYTNSINAMFCSVSAKTNEGIQSIVELIRMNSASITNEQSGPNTIFLNKKGKKMKKKNSNECLR